MIVGTGVDIAEVHRIAAAVKRFGDRFLKRVFTPAEIRYCLGKTNTAERLAARFAAKEAGMKAIGTGPCCNFTARQRSLPRDSAASALISLFPTPRTRRLHT